MSVLSQLYYGNPLAGLVQPDWTKDKPMTPTATAALSAPTTVYDCIVAVSRDIAQQGISKTRNNAQQGYKFRGIDDVLNALSPLLAKYRLVILPRILSRTVVEHASRNGGVLFYVTVEAEFDFVSAADSSKHTVKTYGEAMDSADKATNKAMSAAYKYAAFQTFCIPTEGDNDADAVTHEPVIQLREAPAPTGEREKPAAATVGNRSTSREPGEDDELPPGFALIDGVKQDGDWLHVYWTRDLQGGAKTYKTKVEKIQGHVKAAYADRVPVRLSGKKFPYIDQVERLDGGMSKAELAATKWTPDAEAQP